ncbi:metabotropic glutamate receptor 2 3 (mglur group 2), partial [Reticulomyxa filosa]
CTFNVPKEVSSITNLAPRCGLYDDFDTLLTLFEQSMFAKLNFSNDKNVTLHISGTTNPTFENGFADFAFTLTPSIRWKYSDFKTQVMMSITTNANSSFIASYNFSYHNTVWTVPNGVLAGSILLGCVVMVTAIAFGVLTWYYSDQPVMRGATVPFLAVILCGSVIMGIFVSSLLLLHNYSIALLKLGFCILHLLFVTDSFFFFVKKLYVCIYLFFSLPFQIAKKKLQIVDLSTGKLAVYFLLIPIACLFVYLIPWTFAVDWSPHVVINSNGVVYKTCHYHSAFTSISLVCAAVFLAWIVQLAIGVRNVPKNFNESQWLGASVYTIAVVFLFVLPLAFIDGVSFVTQRMFVAVGCCIATEAMLLFLFGVKFYQIWSGKTTTSEFDRPPA